MDRIMELLEQEEVKNARAESESVEESRLQKEITALIAQNKAMLAQNKAMTIQLRSSS